MLRVTQLASLAEPRIIRDFVAVSVSVRLTYVSFRDAEEAQPTRTRIASSSFSSAIPYWFARKTYVCLLETLESRAS